MQNVLQYQELAAVANSKDVFVVSPQTLPKTMVAQM